MTIMNGDNRKYGITGAFNTYLISGTFYYLKVYKFKSI